MSIRSFTAFALALLFAASARADIQEFRLGFAAQNELIDKDPREHGLDISAELVFSSPDFLDFMARPHPYVMASWNTAGQTSWAGVGLVWKWEFADRFTLAPGVGYVLHNGVLKPEPPDAPTNTDRIWFGSTDLFRLTLSLDYRINDKLGVQVLYEHLSHGQILGNGTNQGLDNLALGVVWHFGDE